MVLARTISFLPKELYNPKAFFTHAAWLDQACAHCPKFPTAASRRSLDRVSVPVWLIILSDQLRIVALVGFTPPTSLSDIGRSHSARSCDPRFPPKSVCGISPSFDRLSPATGHVPIYYSPVRHSPSTCIATRHAAVRLACVKHAASVQSEP